MKSKTLIAALLASTALAGAPAYAADMPARPAFKAPQPQRPAVSGYLEMEAGYSWLSNTAQDYDSVPVVFAFSGKDQKWLFNGAARVNVWLGESLSTQFDIWGGYDTFKKQDQGYGEPIARGSAANVNLGGHLSYRAPGNYLFGMFGALGGLVRTPAVATRPMDTPTARSALRRRNTSVT